jgi:hypothetical protein
LYLYFNFWFLERYCKKKIAAFFVKGATLLQMFLEVFQDPLPTALEGNQYTLAKDPRVLADL